MNSIIIMVLGGWQMGIFLFAATYMCRYYFSILTCSGSHNSAGSMPVLSKNSDHGRLQKVALGES